MMNIQREVLGEIWNLRKVDLFHNLTPDDLDEVVDILTVRSYRQGEYLFHTGEVADCLYLLQVGVVRVSYITLNGDEKILNIFQPGDLFGELFLGKYPLRIGEARAMDDAVAIRITEENFLGLIQRFPEVALNFIRHLVDEQRQIMARMHALMRMEARYRLLGILLSLARRFCCADGEWFTLHESLTQEDIAHMAGLNRSTVSSLINDLRRQGALGGEGRCLSVNRFAVERLLNEAGYEVLE